MESIFPCTYRIVVVAVYLFNVDTGLVNLTVFRMQSVHPGERATDALNRCTGTILVVIRFA